MDRYFEGGYTGRQWKANQTKADDKKTLLQESLTASSYGFHTLLHYFCLLTLFYPCICPSYFWTSIPEKLLGALFLHITTILLSLCMAYLSAIFGCARKRNDGILVLEVFGDGACSNFIVGIWGYDLDIRP